MFSAKFLQELYSVWTTFIYNVFVIALKEYDTHVSQSRVFLYKNVKGIVQSIQNHAFRVGAENDKNDPKGQDKVTLVKDENENCFTLYFYSDKSSHYKTYDLRKFLNPDAFKHVRLQNTFNR